MDGRRSSLIAPVIAGNGPGFPPGPATTAAARGPPVPGWRPGPVSNPASPAIRPSPARRRHAHAAVSTPGRRLPRRPDSTQILVPLQRKEEWWKQRIVTRQWRSGKHSVTPVRGRPPDGSRDHRRRAGGHRRPRPRRLRRLAAEPGLGHDGDVAVAGADAAAGQVLAGRGRAGAARWMAERPGQAARSGRLIGRHPAEFLESAYQGAGRYPDPLPRRRDAQWLT